MSDVSTRILARLITCFERANPELDHAGLRRGLDLAPADADGESRVSWKLVVTWLDRVAVALGDPNAVVEAARRAQSTSRDAHPADDAARRLGSLRVVYDIGIQWVVPLAFPFLRSETEHLDASHARWTLEIPEPYPPCEPFLLLVRGVLESVPRLLDREDAIVTARVSPRSATYDIQIPGPSSREAAALDLTRAMLEAPRIARALGLRNGEPPDRSGELALARVQLQLDDRERLRIEGELANLEAQIRRSQHLEEHGRQAHDLKNLLVAIGIQADLARTADEASARDEAFSRLGEAVERATAAARRLAAPGRRRDPVSDREAPNDGGPRSPDETDAPGAELQIADVRGTETILLVEDDPSVRGVVRGALAACGYDVWTAATGEEALALVAEGKEAVDALVSNVSVAGMDGAVLSERIRERHPALSIILTAAEPDAELTDPVEGAVYLPRPFRFGVLAQLLREALDARES